MNVAPFTAFCVCLLLASCGGGGGGGGSSTPASSSGNSPDPDLNLPSVLKFDSPYNFIDSNAWETARTLISISGDINRTALSSIPSCGGTSSFSSGVLATINWANTTTGVSGETNVAAGCRTVILFGIPLTGLYSGFTTDHISLALGSNELVLITSEGDTKIGRDVIVIERNDGVPPSVLSVYPQNNAADIYLNTQVVVHFNEPMNKASLMPENFDIIDEDGTQVEGAYYYSSAQNVWAFTPVNMLASDEIYTVTLAASISDEGGGGTLGEEIMWTFTTGTLVDTAPLVVSSVWPGDACDCAPTDVRVLVQLDKPVDASSISVNSLQVATQSGAAVAGTTVFNGDYLEFVPDVLFQAGEAYQATLAAGISDLAGNALLDQRLWDFTLSAGDALGVWQALPDLPQTLRGASVLWADESIYIWGVTVAAAESVGYRYVPASEYWQVLANTRDDGFGLMVNFPSPRLTPTLIDNTNEILLFGGDDDGEPAAGGGRYSIASDSWDSMSTGWRDPVSLTTFFGFGLDQHSAIWTGSQLLVWGGFYDSFFNGLQLVNRGWAYTPATDTWKILGSTPYIDADNVLQADTGAPVARKNPVGLWTGSEMLVWGGQDGDQNALNDGGLYDPITNDWRPLSLINTPSGSRDTVSGVWAEEKAIVWNGSFEGADSQLIGAPDSMRRVQLSIWDSVTETWASSASGWEPQFTVVAQRGSHFSFWDGSQMLVVGGEQTGMSYNPDSLSLEAVQTLVVYIYDPQADSWSEGVKFPAVLKSNFTAQLLGVGQMLVTDGERSYVFLYP